MGGQIFFLERRRGVAAVTYRRVQALIFYSSTLNEQIERVKSSQDRMDRIEDPAVVKKRSVGQGTAIGRSAQEKNRFQLRSLTSTSRPSANQGSEKW